MIFVPKLHRENAVLCGWLVTELCNECFQAKTIELEIKTMAKGVNNGNHGCGWLAGWLKPATSYFAYQKQTQTSVLQVLRTSWGIGIPAAEFELALKVEVEETAKMH